MVGAACQDPAFCPGCRFGSGVRSRCHRKQGIVAFLFFALTSLIIRRNLVPRSTKDVAIPWPVLDVNTSLAGSLPVTMDSRQALMLIFTSAMVGAASSMWASVPLLAGH